MTQPVIQVLDENTANKIAAGEVVERPSSVVKELVENSLDAYSHSIEVTIADGGVSLIRVADDGVGMSSEDAQLSILRHATSKIRSVDDLYSVNSLGFRGEALPSIASVSRFSLTTRPHGENLASYVEVTGGVITDVREAGGGAGTVITVADLFFNTPARRKFLKTMATESGYIHDILGKLALSHPEVAFKLINNGRLVLSTPGTGKLLDTMTSLYGLQIAPEVMPVSYEDEGLTITGYIAKPTLIKSSRQWQTFMVNGRVITSRMLAKALDNAYHSLLPKAGYPLTVLNITLAAEGIDVNVHPQKSEVKFSDESRLFKAVYRAVTQALTAPDPKQAAAGLPARTMPEEKKTVYPESRDYAREKPVFSAAALWREESAAFTAVREIIRQEEALPGITGIASPFDAIPEEAAASDNREDSLMLIPLGQIEDCYIIARGPDGLYIVDQHAAHERILYERLSKSSGRIPVQQLLVPLYLDFDAREVRIIGEQLAVFHELGFTLEQVGPEAFRLSEMPADVEPGQARDFIHDILSFVQNAHEPSAAELRHACLQTAACRAAIKAGDGLSMRQIQALLSELAVTALPYTCPHGRPAIVKFTPAELGKMFKRG